MARSGCHSGWIRPAWIENSPGLELLFGLDRPGRKRGLERPFLTSHSPDQSLFSHPPDPILELSHATAGGGATARRGARGGDGDRSHPSSTLSVAFSPIPPAPVRVGEAMVGKGSPRFNMSSSPKVRRYMPTTNASKKKPSPKCSGAKKSGGSPRVKQRADWNPALERSLVDILHEYKDSGYRGDNGWNSEGWNKMVKEFHLRNKYVSYTKAQIQEKEGQLKRDYKMLKAAKQQSGSSWNEKRNMIEGPSAMWTNLMVTFPKIKKFNNNKATFPLFDALGELYDGHLAEGIYNVTSLETPQEKEPPEQLQDAEDEPEGFDDNVVYEVNDEGGDGTEKNEEGLQEMADTLSRDEKNDAPAIERSGQQRPAASRNKQEKELKRPRKNENIVGMMGAYLEMRTKQAEAKAADRAKEMEERERETREREAREKDAAQASDFSIRRCISVLNTMEVTKEEKAKAYAIFIKSKENREAFICACEVDQESALIWLRSEMV